MANQEQISALLDGESRDAQVIDALCNDAEQRESMRRYALIGELMRTEPGQHVELNIADSVAAALEQEPAHVAPTIDVAQEPVLEDQPLPGGGQVLPFRLRDKVVPMFKRVGQYAIAASVAVFVIGGVQLHIADKAAQDAPSPVLNTVPVFGGVAAPVSLSNDRPAQPIQPVLSEQELMEQQQKINAYLQDYRLQMKIQPQPAQ